MVKCHAQKQRMEGSIYLTYTSMSLLILDKAELLSLNTHFRRGISYSHHGCLYAGTSNYVPAFSSSAQACMLGPGSASNTIRKHLLTEGTENYSFRFWLGLGSSAACLLPRYLWVLATKIGNQSNFAWISANPDVQFTPGSSHCIQLSGTSTETSPSTESGTTHHSVPTRSQKHCFPWLRVKCILRLGSTDEVSKPIRDILWIWVGSSITLKVQYQILVLTQ